MDIPTRYGSYHVTKHAIERWRQRTGLSEWDLIGAVLKARRPTKNQLRRIMKRRCWRPQRILMCPQAYFVIRDRNIVTVYDREKRPAPLYEEERNENGQLLMAGNARCQSRAKWQPKRSGLSVDMRLTPRCATQRLPLGPGSG